MSVLSHKDIVEQCKLDPPLIDPFDAKPLETLYGAKYYLTVGDLILPNSECEGNRRSGILFFEEIEKGKVGSQFELKPSQMITAYTKEQINLPNNICALLNAVNKKAREGLFLLNLGHIDPGWRGPLTVTMVNYGKKPIVLTAGEPIASITFFRLTTPVDENYMYKKVFLSSKPFIENLQGVVGMHIPTTFFDVDRLVDEKVTKALHEYKKHAFRSEIKVFAIVILVVTILTYFLTQVSPSKYFIIRTDGNTESISIEKFQESKQKNRTNQTQNMPQTLVTHSAPTKTSN